MSARRPRSIALGLALLAASLPFPALAEEGLAPCGPKALVFAFRCGRTTGHTVRARLCGRDRTVFEIDGVRSSGPLEVEVRRDPKGAFRSAGGMGLAPVGDFADWRAEPAREREAFDAFAGCLGTNKGDLFEALAGEDAEPGGATEGSCGRRAIAWASACKEGYGVAVRALSCEEKQSEFSLEGTPVRVRVKPAAGGVALEIVPPSATQDPSGREVIERFRACAFAGGEAIFDRADVVTAPVPTTLPFRLLFGSALALLVALATRRAPRSWILPILLGVFSWGFAAIAITPAWFHQNGQGPDWIGRFAGGNHCWYGPGYFEVFGKVARLWPGGRDGGVVFLQSLLVATVPISAFAIARAIGAGRFLSLALALGCACEPVICRMSRSESYFGPTVSLLFAAAATLLGGARAGRLRSAPFVAGAIGAGLFIAQAARVHGYSWVPAAFLPLTLLFQPGAVRRKLAGVAMASGIIAVVVAVGAGPAMWRVLHDPKGGEWAARANHQIALFHLTFSFRAVIALAAAAGIAALASRGRAIAAFSIALAAIGVHVGIATKMQLAHVGPWVDHGYALLYGPTIVSCAAAVLSRLPRGRRSSLALAALTLASLLAYDASAWPRLTRLPTETEETLRVARWLRSLPPGAELWWLGRAGQRSLDFPIYAGDARRQVPHNLWLHELPTALAHPTPGSYYLHSSMCSVPETRDACDALEARLHLEPIERATVPRRPSMLDLGYDRDPVPIVLYRVKPDEPPSSPGR